MRVKGNLQPPVLSIETYLPIDGTAIVRLCENINEVTEIDEMTKESYALYEYDEYIFIVPEKEDLKENIELNLNDWIATGRTLEINERASVIQEMKSALEILGVSE